MIDFMLIMQFNIKGVLDSCSIIGGTLGIGTPVVVYPFHVDNEGELTGKKANIWQYRLFKFKIAGTNIDDK